jgi:hypothetical protein
LFHQAADLNHILSERGACGVGFVANLKNMSSFDIVRDALMALGCMEHRGGCGADSDSGDGAGLMSAVPWDLFDDWASKQGLALFDRRNTGVGMVFLPQDEKSMEEAKAGKFFMLIPHRAALFLSKQRNIFNAHFYRSFILINHCLVAAYFNYYMEFLGCHTLHAHKATTCLSLEIETFWNVVSLIFITLPPLLDNALFFPFWKMCSYS